ncbi:metal-sensing transcriptional repressor [candidate division KSB1 bacterium]|nr:metal-sensing transcriptional repressor [candidate division KSB1 bacterium]MBL7108106.1 metal-sensing transcriptional repressor [Candidatus Cloacimonadota bacterium]
MKKVCESCSTRNAHHSEELKKSFQDRLHRIEGQVRAVNRMIAENVYCDDILNQISAIQSALTSVSKLLLDAHMKSCVVEQIKEGKIEVIDEVMKTIDKLMRK